MLGPPAERLLQDANGNEAGAQPIGRHLPRKAAHILDNRRHTLRLVTEAQRRRSVAVGESRRAVRFAAVSTQLQGQAQSQARVPEVVYDVLLGSGGF